MIGYESWLGKGALGGKIHFAPPPLKKILAKYFFTFFFGKLYFGKWQVGGFMWHFVPTPNKKI